MKHIKPGCNLISSMELQQPYTGIVTQAVGVRSAFASMVQKDRHDEVVERYLKLKEYRDKKEKPPKDLKPLTTKETLVAENILKKKEAEGKQRRKHDTDGPKLDGWQREAIDLIMAGRSVAIFGPTSGGKTYLVKYAINEMRGTVRRALFVAPTFHLALQTYADIQATYSGFPATLITDKINQYHKDSWIYVGTAECLLNYVQSQKEEFEVGIFDEVHSLNTDTFTDQRRVDATHTLLSLCRRQVIALSATVSDADVPRVVEYLQERTGIPVVAPVCYRERAVPQRVYLYNKGLAEVAKMKAPRVAEPDYTPERMFKLILTMRAFGMFPTLLFGMKNMSLRAFTELISFIEQEESREYARYHAVGKALNPFIDDYNQKLAEFNSKVGAAALTKDAQKACEVLKAHRQKLLESCLERVKDEIRKVHTLIEEAEEIKYGVPLEGWNKGVRVEGVDWSDEDYVPTVELVDLCDLYKAYDHAMDSESPMPESVPAVSEAKGSFFRFGSNVHHVFNEMREGRKTEQVDKFRGVMTKMAEAEGLSDTQMWKFVDFIGRGLDFGICALLKEFPFFIQYQILEMMKDKSLAAIFASESMSMGINYPLRSVVIFSPELTDVPVSHLMQMAGRCGRRGLDKKSFVVYWGIRNALQAEVESISFPEDEYEMERAETHSLLIGPKEDMQACYTRHYLAYSEGDRSLLRDAYKERCVEEYRRAYNL